MTSYAVRNTEAHEARVTERIQATLTVRYSNENTCRFAGVQTTYCMFAGVFIIVKLVV